MDIIEAIAESKSMLEASRKCGLHFSTFKRRAEKLGVYKPNQAGKGISKKFVRNRFGGPRKLSDILEGKHPQYPTMNLKKRLKHYRKEVKILNINY